MTLGGDREYSSSGTDDDSAFIRFNISSEGNDVHGSGIPDNLEVFGIRDASGNMVANLAALGANPRRKDVLVEIDCMVSDGNGNGYSPFDPANHSHCPLELALADVVQAFATPRCGTSMVRSVRSCTSMWGLCMDPTFGYS
jgi:hypothetical protein